MATQPSYPGVYIQEFAPGAPIEGVGTNTAAFIGVAVSGPIGVPTLIQSWDAFVAVFGGFIADPPTGFLAAGVYGFFLNGGTTCYVLRVGSGTNASVPLPSRQGGPTPDPALLARALAEGPAGNSVSVQVSNSSRLTARLASSVATRGITAMAGDRVTLTLANNNGIFPGAVLVLRQGANVETGVVATVTLPNLAVLAAAIPGAVDFTGGTAEAGTALAAHTGQSTINAVSIDRATLTVVSNAAFAANDRLLLTQGANNATVVVRSVQGTDTVVLTGPIPGAAAFATGTARVADFAAGQRSFRVDAPPTMALNQALPRGSLVSLTLGATTEILTVESSGGDTVTFTAGLVNTFSLAAAGNPPVLASLEFDLAITDTGTGNSETFTQLSMNPNHPSFWSNTVASEIVAIDPPPAPPAPAVADTRPAAGTYALINGVADDRATALSGLIANPTAALDLLRPIDEIALVAIPGVTDPVVQQAIIAHCETMHDRFAILDAVLGSTPTTIRNQVAQVRSEDGFAALYYPWIRARNPLTGRDELWPPSGHMAGIYARTDAQRGVHKAPANTNIRGAIGLEVLLTDAQHGPLNLDGIDVLRVFPGQAQPIVWGARTTADGTTWQYINIRRLFLYLEESIEEGIRWAIFEPNNTQLWQKLKRSITEFLTRVWRDGALFGETADKAFYVRIDEVLNPPSTRALGRLYIEVGVKPSYPAEFIILRIGIWQGGSEISES